MFYAVLVDADNYLLKLLRYIHLNPVRAGITPSPMDYPWSSHHVYLGTRNEAWVTTEFALSLLHSDLHTAVTAYQQFVEATSPQLSSSPLIHRNPNDPRILGAQVARLFNRNEASLRQSVKANFNYP